MSSKSWIYTLNNYTEQEVEQFKAFTCSKHRCCKETSQEGTPHLQGAITFKRAYRMVQLKKLCPRAHWETAKAIDSENYCTKGEIIIDFTQSKQGTRTDLTKVSEMVISGLSQREIALEHPTVFMKYHNGISALSTAISPYYTTWQPVSVYALIGKPRTGKTRYVWDNYPDVYNVMSGQKDKIWFDGYTGQEVILFDDFTGQVSYEMMLQILEGYPMTLPIKGSTVRKNWRKVYLTSNVHPREWYPQIKNTKALLKRFIEIKIFTKIKECPDHEKLSDVVVNEPLLSKHPLNPAKSSSSL